MADPLPKKLAPWRHSLAAAQSASEVSAELLRSVREGDAADHEEVIARLVDATVNVIGFAPNSEPHNQLLGALQKWQSEHGY